MVDWTAVLDGLLTYNTVKLVTVRDKRLGLLKYTLIFALTLYSKGILSLVDVCARSSACDWSQWSFSRC